MVLTRKTVAILVSGMNIVKCLVFKELDQLIINICKKSSFDNFLQALSKKEMQHAA
ncbi:hypothetical protein BDW71DRAFT_208369 [Aspergillus fruticulosus]